MTEERPLEPHERATLSRILEGASFPGASGLLAQVPKAKIVGGLDTFLELEVLESAPRSSFREGHIPVRAFVEGEHKEPEGELLLWVRDGYLSALEIAWYTDDAPTKIPSADRIRLEEE